MTVNSNNIEFGYELISIIPFANYLAKQGKLKTTISGADTKCLYYFSPNHIENNETRCFTNTNKCKHYPNIRIHKPTLDKSRFLVPDYKSKYANNRFKFDKEIIIICNRYNVEWSVRPINYFDIPTLEEMFKLLSDKYQVVYINIRGRKELYDSHIPIDFEDYELVKRYPKVINIHELHKVCNDLTFNELQLMLFANCKKYITMNGGHAILSTYFGGENILYSKFGTPMTQELRAENNSFYRWYSEFGGQRVVHVCDELELFERIKLQWIEKQPIVNILVRTSKRKHEFAQCIDSILDQTHSNINIWVSIDDKSNDYTIPFPVYPVFVNKVKEQPAIPDNPEYGRPFQANLYMNELQDQVKEGIIMYLDDDNYFCNDRCVEKVVNEFKKGSELVFWKYNRNGRIVPSKENFGKEPVLCDIDTNCFAYLAKHKKYAIWEPYRRGDFRVVKKLYSKINKVAYIDKVMAATQTEMNVNCWFKTSDNKFWFGNPALVKDQIDKRKFTKLRESEVPKQLIQKR